MEPARLAKQWATSTIPTASPAALVVSQTYPSLSEWLPCITFILLAAIVRSETHLACFLRHTQGPASKAVSFICQL